MTKNTLTLRESNIRCISTVAHPFGVIKSYKGHHILRDFNKTIPLNFLTKEIKSVEEGKPIEEFYIDYSGKSYATKDRLARCLKKATGHDYIITDYNAIWKGYYIKIHGYRVEAVRTDYLKDYTISKKDKKRLEKQETRRLNKKLNKTFVVDPFAAALHSIDDRLHMCESHGCILVSADVLKYLSVYVSDATFHKRARKAYKEFFEDYNDTLKGKILKAANDLGLYTIEELPLKGRDPEYYTQHLLKIRKVNTDLHN